MSEIWRAAPRARAAGWLDGGTLLQRAEDLVRRSAEVADAVATNLEDLAATYRRMAQTSSLPETQARLLEHVSRLEERAVHEREAADRFRKRSTPPVVS